MPPQEPFKWRQETAVAISKTAFGKLALEYGPKFRVTQIGSSAYGALETDDGFDFYYTADAWLYQARRVATQANIAGGAMFVNVVQPSGQVGRIVGVHANNSGTNGLIMQLLDEDGAQGPRLLNIASGAATQGCIPSVGTASNASVNLAQSPNMPVGPGQRLQVAQSGAGAQNDTLTIYVVLLLSGNTEPTWNTTGSTNPGDITLAASTISVANTMQAVLLP